VALSSSDREKQDPFGETGYTGVDKWAVAEARIDNVLLTPEPASLLLLVLGGVALLRKHAVH
jgi:hypothetical protein